MVFGVILLLIITSNVYSQINTRSITLSSGLSHYVYDSEHTTNGPNGNASFSYTKYKNKKWSYSVGFSYASAYFEHNSYAGAHLSKLKYVQLPVLFSRRFFSYSNHNLNISTGFFLSQLLEWSEGEVINGEQSNINYLDNVNHTAVGFRFSPGYSYQLSDRIKLHAKGAISYKIGESTNRSADGNTTMFTSLDDCLSLSVNMEIEVLFGNISNAWD